MIEHKDLNQETVEATGGNWEHMDDYSLICMHLFLYKIGCKVHFVHNGLNSGNHDSVYHDDGKAFDLFLEKDIPYQKVFAKALECGFRGLGYYHNRETGYQGYHLDTRSEVGFWAGVKDKTKDNWEYVSIFKDLR